MTKSYNKYPNSSSRCQPSVIKGLKHFINNVRLKWYLVSFEMISRFAFIVIVKKQGMLTYLDTKELHD